MSCFARTTHCTHLGGTTKHSSRYGSVRSFFAGNKNQDEIRTVVSVGNIRSQDRSAPAPVKVIYRRHPDLIKIHEFLR